MLRVSLATIRSSHGRNGAPARNRSRAAYALTNASCDHVLRVVARPEQGRGADRDPGMPDHQLGVRVTVSAAHPGQDLVVRVGVQAGCSSPSSPCLHRRRATGSRNAASPAPMRERGSGAAAQEPLLIMPAPTVTPVASSIRMNEPVVRFFEYGSHSSGTVVRSWTRPISLRPSSLVSWSRCSVLTSRRYWMSLTSARAVRVVCLIASFWRGLQRRVGHPADHRVDVLAGLRGVLDAGDHVAAGDVDVVLEAHGHRHRRERLGDLLVEQVDARDLRGHAAGQHDDLVAGLEDAAGDHAAVAAVVVVLVGLRADDVLHREADVDQVAVGGDVDVLEVVHQRRAGVPRHVLGPRSTTLSPWSAEIGMTSRSGMFSLVANWVNSLWILS